MRTLQELITDIDKKKKYIYLKFKASRLLIRNYRYTGKRAEAAEGYHLLSILWQKILLSDLPKYINKRELILERTNDYLWAARYQALVGDKKLALYYSTLAMRELDENRGNFSKNKEYTKYKELFSEAYYLRSFKIFLYFGDYKKSTYWAKEALKDLNLNVKWKKKILWVLGLSYFLNKDYKLAQNTWKKSLRYHKRETSRAKILFWMVRASKIIKNYKKFKHYEKELNKKYPFNFYSLLKKKRFLPKQDKTLAKKHKRKSYSTNKTLNTSIIRAEILIQLKMFRLAQAELSYAYKLTHPRRYSNKNLPLYTYLNKLFHKAKYYHRSIAFSQRLSAYYKNFWKRRPEQISLYYPMAFLSSYERASYQSNINLSLLYGISRQESLFRKDAVSYANAIGVMQITPNTALSIAKRLKIKEFSPATDLKNVSRNLRIGSQYLRELKKRYQQEISPTMAMIAAYNAGEFAVDEWLDKIRVKDKLLWIEALPFSQTRNYVKLVLSNVKVYDTILNYSKEEEDSYLQYTHAKIKNKF